MQLTRVIVVACFGLMLLPAIVEVGAAQGTEDRLMLPSGATAYGEGRRYDHLYCDKKEIFSRPSHKPEFAVVRDEVAQDKTGGPKPDKGQGVVATCAAFSPDNKFVLVGFGGGSLKKQPERTALADCLILFDVANGKEIRSLKGHAGGVYSVAFFPDGNRAVSGGNDGYIRVWDVLSGAELWSFELKSRARCELSSDGKQVLIHFANGVELWDVVKGKRLNAVAMPKENISSVTLSPNGEQAFLNSYSLYLWDVKNARTIEEFKLTETGKPTVKMSQLVRVVRGLGSPAAFAPNGQTAIIGKYDAEKRYLAIWDIAKKSEIRQIGDDALWPLAVCFTGEGNVTCHSQEGRLVSWDTQGKQLWETKSKDLEGLRFLVFSKDGKVALSNYGGLFVLGEQRPVGIDFESNLSLRIWNLENGKLVRTLTEPQVPEAKR